MKARRLIAIILALACGAAAAGTGKVSVVEAIDSPQLKNRRALRIYLPPGYDQSPFKRYPVIYMHDGQNLFDARTAAYGEEWRIDETIDSLVASGKMLEVIVVGIDNTADRIAEYTPCCDPKYGGGKLDAYSSFITDTVKPWVDARYRTLVDPAHTAIMGSSLGGLASVLIAQRRPDIFGMSAGLSGSFWWNGRNATHTVAARVPVRFYLDAGTRDDGLDDTRLMRDALTARGYIEGIDLHFHVAEGAAHNEKAWAARVDKPLRWFFPPSLQQPGSGTGVPGVLRQ